MIDKTTATKILQPLCELNGYHRGMGTVRELLRVAEEADSPEHLRAAVTAWTRQSDKFPTPKGFLNILLKSASTAESLCALCQKFAILTHKLKTPKGGTEPCCDGCWQWYQRLVSGARKCECVKGT